jgi:hypothetical protein
MDQQALRRIAVWRRRLVFALAFHLVVVLVLNVALFLSSAPEFLWILELALLASLLPLMLGVAMLGWSMYTRVGWVVIDVLLMFVPGIHILIPLSLNRIAKDKLKEADMEVSAAGLAPPRALG